MIGRIIEFYRVQRDKIILRRYKKEGFQIGEHCLNTGKLAFGQEPYLIKIGNYVRLSPGVMFVTHDPGTLVFRELPEYKGLRIFDTIEIKDNCFIGANVIITPGVTIGPNSIVGANSVVTKDVPPNTVVGGCPAKHICTYEEYIQKTVPKCHHYPEEDLKNPKKRRQLILDVLKAERGEDIFNRSGQKPTGNKKS
jgi:acetyltransferase-like isoleucine patch superfamily enzyme